MKDEAVFAQYDVGGASVTVYFPPSAEPLAKSFGAVPCEKPVPNERFTLLAGDETRAWDAHFPGYLTKQKARRQAELRGRTI